MKHFLHKKWLSIPVMVVLILALTAGSLLAAYNFLDFTTEITIDEPLTVEIAWYDYNNDMELTEFWVLEGSDNSDELTIEMSPAEVQTFALKVYNTSYGELTIKTEFAGQVAHFDFAGWPNGTIDGSNGDNSVPEWVTRVATITADGDTPPDTYSVTVRFTRE